jgi:hypothetical protein
MMKEILDQVLAGCLISPGLEASQNSLATLPESPSHPCTTAIRKTAIETKATTKGIAKTNLLFLTDAIMTER